MNNKGIDLVGTRWQLKNINSGLMDSKIEFRDNGKLIDSDCAGTAISWSRINMEVEFNYNNGYAIYKGTLNNHVIIGTARNVIGTSWDFEAKIISEDLNLVGTRWLFKEDNPDLEDTEIEFCADGKLLDKLYSNPSANWVKINNVVTLDYNNGGIIYNGTIDNSVISGTAQDHEGNSWKFTVTRISEMPFHLPAQSQSSNEAIFLIKKKKEEFTYFYHYQYYPQRFQVSEELQNVRKVIWGFKDGLASREIAIDLSKGMRNLNLNYPISKWWLCVIPASTKVKTEKRFKVFCEKFSELTNINNGYSLIFSKSDRGAKHLQADRTLVDILDSIDFANVNGKNILLFDDIYTTGKSFLKVSRKLKALGANEVVGMFLGKTHWLEDEE